MLRFGVLCAVFAVCVLCAPRKHRPPATSSSKLIPKNGRHPHPTKGLHSSVIDLEKASWKPYDPSQKNNEAIVDKSGALAMPGVITEGMSEKDIKEHTKLANILKETARGAEEDYEFSDDEENNVDLEKDPKDPEDSQATIHYIDFPCLNLVVSRLGDAPKPQPEAFRDFEHDLLQSRTNSFVLDTILGEHRPLYLASAGYSFSGSKKSLEDLFELLNRDQRPLLTQITISTGIDHAITWVIQSVNGEYRIFQASQIDSYSLQDWISPEKWQSDGIKKGWRYNKKGENSKIMFTIPKPSSDYEAAKFGFGAGQMLRNTTLVAYRNNVRQFLAGLCTHDPPLEYYYSTVALWGSSDGFAHSSNCNLHYEIYEYDPNVCYQVSLSDNTNSASSVEPFPEYGFMHT